MGESKEIHRHHHRHHHYHEDSTDRMRRHRLSARKRRKLINNIAFLIFSFIAVIILIYCMWIYSN